MHPIFQASTTPPQYASPPQAQPDMHFYFYDDIGETKDYCDLIYQLDHASEHDNIHLHLATGGGNMEAAIVIVHAIMRTNANVIAYAEAGVASAGTIIMLACHQIYVYPHAHFLFHDGSLTGPGMKFSENLKQAQAIVDVYAKLAHSIYVPFFTASEVDDILRGIDCYVSSDEMQERLVRGFAILEKQHADEAKAAGEAP